MFTKTSNLHTQFLENAFFPGVFERKQTKGRCCKRAVLANVPSFRLWGPGKSKIAAFFCQGNIAGKDFLEEMSVPGNICQNPTLLETILLRTPGYLEDATTLEN